MVISQVFHASWKGLLFLYFAIHMLHSDQGLVARFIEQHKQERLLEDIEIIRAERLKLERDIALIKGEQVDADLLDELARRQLPLAGERDVMVLR